MIGTESGSASRSRLRGEAAGSVAIAAAIAFTALSEGGYGVVFSAVSGLAIWWGILCVLALHRDAAGRVAGTALAAIALLAAYSLWAALSVLWAANAAGALYEAAKLLAYLGAFCGAVLLARNGSGRMWVGGLTGGLLGIAVIALSIRFFPFIDGDRETLQASLPSAQGRLGFPIGYWNALAACMAMAIALLSPLAVFSTSRIRRSLCTALIPLPVLVIYLASSRGGAVAAGVGVLAIMALSPRRTAIAASLAVAAPASLLITALAADQEGLLQGLGSDAAGGEGLLLFAVTLAAVLATFAARFLLDEHLARLSLPRWARLAIPAIAAVTVIAGVVAVDPVQRWRDFKDPPDFGASASSSSFVASHLQSGNGNGRYQFWGTALDAFGDAPVKGLGAGGFATYWNQNGPIEYRLRDAHSLVFEAASELGVVGLAAILGFFGLVGWTGVRRAVAEHHQTESLPEAALLIGVLAAGLAAILVDWTWEIPAVAVPMLIASALLVGRAPGTRRDGSLRIGLIVIAIVSVPLLANVFLTELQLRESREAVASGELTEAADAAERAEALAPWAAEPRVQAALISERLGDLDTARSEIDEAIERSPEDWKLQVIASRLALEADDASAAKSYLDEARRLNPRSAILLERPLPPGILPDE